MVEVPLSFEKIKPLTLLYWPSFVPVTVTLNAQLPPAAREPPINEMVSGAVVISVPPHSEVEESATVKPVGKTSVKATPVNA